MIFTTSWDDGYALDLKVADLLDQYGCKGTFYVSPHMQHEADMLTVSDIQKLSERHEIGAHTLTHPRLTQLSAMETQQEIEGSKKWVEEQTQHPCEMFCYPFGDTNAEVRNIVEKAGFRGARTVEAFRFTIDDPFLMPTSLHLYTFPWRRRWTRWWHALDPLGPQRAWSKKYRALRVPFSAQWNWLSLAKYLFLYSLEWELPFFHLWGHGAEIERFNLWKDLEEFLAFVEKQQGVEHQVNSGLIS